MYLKVVEGKRELFILNVLEFRCEEGNLWINQSCGGFSNRPIVGCKVYLCDSNGKTAEKVN